MERFIPERHNVAAAIETSSVFDAVVGEAREQVIGAFDGVRLETGETLIAEGETADALYVVRHGRLRTDVNDADGTPRQVGEIGKGEVVGEMALITDEPRAATVVALRDTELYRLPAEQFVELTARFPELLRPFASVVVERLRRTISAPDPAPLPATIVLLPAAGVDVDSLADALHSEIVQYRTAVVRPADAAGHADTAAWLLDLENAVDVSLLVADPTPTAWTRQCLRHADRVLLVADENASPTLGPVEVDARCAARLAEIPLELVMYYRSAPQASAWLVDRNFGTHHNVRQGSVDDVGRLVRRVTGGATVLVLGGGGARGFAHFGVIEGLIGAGIAIDAIVGTSAGALVGGMLARYGDIDERRDEFMQWFTDVRWRRDFTPPTMALLTGRLMSEGFQEAYGDRRLEDLEIDYAAVSTDLTNAQPYIHTSGLLWLAVRASAAVPGIFPPVFLGDRVLVDGGLVANLPVAIARERHPGSRIIAVDVGDSRGFSVRSSGKDGVASGWTALRRRHEAATLPKVLLRLTELGQNADASGAAVVIRPDLAGFSLTDTTAMHEIVERGRVAVKAALDAGDV